MKMIKKNRSGDSKASGIRKENLFFFLEIGVLQARKRRFGALETAERKSKSN